MDRWGGRRSPLMIRASALDLQGRVHMPQLTSSTMSSQTRLLKNQRSAAPSRYRPLSICNESIEQEGSSSI